MCPTILFLHFLQIWLLVILLILFTLLIVFTHLNIYHFIYIFKYLNLLYVHLFRLHVSLNILLIYFIYPVVIFLVYLDYMSH